MADPKTEQLIDEYGKALYEFRAAEDANIVAQMKANAAFDRQETARKAMHSAGLELQKHIRDVVFPPAPVKTDPDIEHGSRAGLAELERELARLKSAVDTIPAALMLAGGPPYRLTFTEACLREILESQK